MTKMTKLALSTVLSIYAPPLPLSLIRQTLKDTGRTRVRELQIRYFILEPIWNPKNKRPSVIFAKPLILWCPHTDSNRGPTDYKSVALPAEL